MGGGVVNQAFTAYIEINKTYAKCNSDEHWAQEWIDLNSSGLPKVPCNTTNYPLVVFPHHG